MSCERSAQVHAYHDDALAPSDRAALQAHLDGCADCRALLADLRGLSGLIATAPRAAISPEAMARLAEGWRAAHDRGLLRISGWLTAAAAGILVGALLFFPERTTTSGPTVMAPTGNGDASWETLAVMPPPTEGDEGVPEVIVLATWMANDLSYGPGGSNGNGGGGGERR